MIYFREKTQLIKTKVHNIALPCLVTCSVLIRSLASLLLVVCLTLEVGYVLENTLAQDATQSTIRACDHDFKQSHVWLLADEIEENSEGKSKEHSGLDVLVHESDHLSRLYNAKYAQDSFLAGLRVVAHHLNHRVLRI